MIHARVPHFLWPYVLRYAAHQVNLQLRVSRLEVSPTHLWTGSLGVGSAFRVWGCLALVRDTSADKLSARAIPCVFLSFPVGSPDFSFYHLPLHQFLDSYDIQFDESVSYYTRYPCRGLPVPPPPLFIAPSPPPAPTPPPSPPPPGPAPSGGVGAGGTGTAGASSGGAGAGGTGTGGASSGGAGAGGAGDSGASSGGAGAGGTGAGGASSGGAGAGGAGAVGASTEETGAEGTPTAAPTAPPHRYDTHLQDLRRLEREEQERLELKRQE
ncbi:unnamed protein product [Closterium sp. NIES-53]